MIRRKEAVAKVANPEHTRGEEAAARAKNHLNATIERRRKKKTNRYFYHPEATTTTYYY
jgi:hypothetical protein